MKRQREQLCGATRSRAALQRTECATNGCRWRKSIVCSPPAMPLRAGADAERRASAPHRGSEPLPARNGRSGWPMQLPVAWLRWQANAVHHEPLFGGA